MFGGWESTAVFGDWGYIGLVERKVPRSLLGAPHGLLLKIFHNWFGKKKKKKVKIRKGI